MLFEKNEDIQKETGLVLFKRMNLNLLRFMMIVNFAWTIAQ